jgi:F-type H+-transporting ATPase subunit b
MNIAIALLAEANAGEGGQIQQIARTFGVSWSHLIAQIISFSIVCYVLHRFAYRRVLEMLEQRRQHIAEGLGNAEKIKAELAEAKAQRQELMVQASAQAKAFIEEARAAAARVREQETQQAVAAAEQILVKAREAAVLDHDRMLLGLKREVLHLVTQATAAVTGKVLTPEDQRVLAAETADALDGRNGPLENERAGAAMRAAGTLLENTNLGVALDENEPKSPTDR